MNSTAALKAMADAMGQNQQATAALGASRNQALAALAGARTNAGTGFANARAANSAAASQLGGQGAAAYANLGGALGTAAANLGGMAAQSEGAMRSAGAGALGNISAAESSALAGLGAAASGAMGSLGPSFATAAGNDLNYTRDMAKLGLARELGLVGVNAAGAIAGGFGGGGGLDNTLTVSSPDGVLAEGSFGSVGGGGGGGGGFSAINPYANTPWYASRQDAGGRGLAALGGLQSQIADSSGLQALNVRESARGSRGDLGSIMGAGSGNIAASRMDGMGQIAAQGAGARSGILDALAAGQDQIAESGRGIGSDALTTYGALDRTNSDIMSGDVLAALNSNYGSGMSQLQGAFARGQRDPRDIYDRTLGGLSSLMNPLLQRGSDALRDYYAGFPTITTTPGAGGSVNPQPFLDELRRAYDPYMSNLNTAFQQQNNRIGQGVGMAGAGYRRGMGDLGGQLGVTQGALNNMFNTIMNDHVGRLLPRQGLM